MPQNARPDDWPLAPLLRLTLTPGLGPITQRRLLQRFHSPAEIFTASRHQWREILSAKQAELLESFAVDDALDRIWQWQLQPQHHLLTILDEDYPPRLCDLGDAPLLLYLLGNRALLAESRTVAIIGSRHATSYGVDVAYQFARDLAARGLLIISGLALGCDSAAHRGALERGATLAVIGTGVDRIYPPVNEALARRIAEKGVLVSEFPLGTRPQPQNFPLRNRLIAALAQGVLVVQMGERSGAMITSRLAMELGREVFAVPNSIHEPLSRGCHRLLRDGAKLVDKIEDVLEELRL